MNVLSTLLIQVPGVFGIVLRNTDKSVWLCWMSKHFFQTYLSIQYGKNIMISWHKSFPLTMKGQINHSYNNSFYWKISVLLLVQCAHVLYPIACFWWIHDFNLFQRSPWLTNHVHVSLLTKVVFILVMESKQTVQRNANSGQQRLRNLR